MKGFNLKAKLLSAKDRMTDALAQGVVAIDAVAGSAIETASGLTAAAQEKVSGIKTAVTDKVGQTVDTVKGKTSEKLGQLGSAIDTRASKVSEAAAEFGAAAKRKLGSKPAVVAAPVAEKPVKVKAKAKTAKRPAKKVIR